MLWTASCGRHYTPPQPAHTSIFVDSSSNSKLTLLVVLCLCLPLLVSFCFCLSVIHALSHTDLTQNLFLMHCQLQELLTKTSK